MGMECRKVRQKRKSEKIPAMCVIAGGMLWGCISIFVKRLTAGGCSSLQIAMIRGLFGAAMMVGYLLVKDKRLLRIRLRDIWIFAGTGIVSLALFNWCYFSAIQQSQASVAVVLLYTSPIFVMLMSAVFFHERITKRKVAALLLAFAGCVLVAGLLGGSYRLSLHVLLLGIGSGIFYATYSIFGRVALQRYDSLTVTAYTFLFATLGTLPIGDLPGVGRLLQAEPELILWCLGIAFFCTVLPYLFYTSGLQGLEAGKAAVLATVEPLVGTVIGVALFQEPFGLMKGLGILCILAAVVILR